MLAEQLFSHLEFRPMDYCVEQFSVAFNQAFKDYLVTLSPGADEPFYQAATATNHVATIFSTKDYFSSAFHEIAHWCIAGKERRQLDDYGYWYEPDGRNSHQQALFYQVEAKPQALEWAFSLAARIDFRLSLDNLHSIVSDDEKLMFRDKVFLQLTSYFESGFPLRAQKVIQLLSSLYSNHQPIQQPKKSSCLL
jgi:elongation factor P hydroxylase